MNSHKALLTVVLAAGLAACGRGGKGNTEHPVAGEPPAPGAAAAAVAAPVAAPAAEATDDVFEVSGVAAAVRNSRVSMKAGGVMASIKVREGMWVSQGQPLCSLDTVDLTLRAEAADVAARLAAAGAANAAQDLKRAKELYKGGAATDQVIEKTELGLTVANLQAEQAKVALKMAQQALYDATMRAPFAGVITKVFTEEGMMVTTMPPTSIFQLVDTTVLEVRTPIPERMLSQVKVGQPVIVYLPAVKLERQAKIDRIPEVVDPATRSVEAVIRIDNKDRAIPAGLYARVRFPEVHPELAAAIPGEGEAPKAGGQP